MGYCSAERWGGKKITTIHGKRDKATFLKLRSSVRRTDLQYLVLSLKVFFFIGITLRKLVDVDPKLLDFLFDLQHISTSAQLCDFVNKILYIHIYFRLYLLLLSAHLCWRQAVSFGQHRNYIDFFMQGLHALHVQRSETATHAQVCEDSDLLPVAEWQLRCQRTRD